MIDYIDELKKLRFNFHPEEVIDYQSLITLAGSIMIDENYEKYSDELFHTVQILVLIYGLDEQVEATKFDFDYNNLNINDLNLYKYLVYILYNDLVRSSEFTITDDTRNKFYIVLNLLDTSFNSNNVEIKEHQINDNHSQVGLVVDDDPYVFVEPDSHYNFTKDMQSKNNDPLVYREEKNNDSLVYKEEENLNSFNWNYLRDYIIQNNLLPYQCSECGISSWQNKPISLILNKKDKNSSDQNLCNLKFLCPNCNSQLGN